MSECLSGNKFRVIRSALIAATVTIIALLWSSSMLFGSDAARLRFAPHWSWREYIFVVNRVWNLFATMGLLALLAWIVLLSVRPVERKSGVNWVCLVILAATVLLPPIWPANP